MARLWKGKSRTGRENQGKIREIGFMPWCAQDQAGGPAYSIPPPRTAVTDLAGPQWQGGQETRATATYSAWLIKYLRMGKGSSTACAELSTYPGSFGTAGRGDLSIPVVWCMGEQTHHGPHVSPRTEGMSPETQPSKTPQRSKAFPPGSPFNLPS